MSAAPNEALAVEEVVAWRTLYDGDWWLFDIESDAIDFTGGQCPVEPLVPASLLTTIAAERDNWRRVAERLAHIEPERDALRSRVERLAKRYDDEADRLEQASVETLSVADKLRLDASASQCREIAAAIRRGEP